MGEVLSEALEETSIEAVQVVPEVLEAEVQVVLVLGVVIAVVTKTNVGGSKQDKIDLTSYFRYSIQSMSSTIAINDTPISCKFLEKFTFHSFFFLQFMCTTIYTTVLHATICKKICSTSIVIEPKPQY